MMYRLCMPDKRCVPVVATRHLMPADNNALSSYPTADCIRISMIERSRVAPDPFNRHNHTVNRNVLSGNNL